MKYLACALISATISLSAPALYAKEIEPLTVKAEGIGANGFILPDYAFCVISDKNHVKDGGDKSIGLSWSPGPAGTKSYAIIALDPDVPAVFTDAGKEGKVLPATMPRKPFFHWILLDIPATTSGIPAGADSPSLAPHGKSDIKTTYGVRGVNDFGPYMASNPERKGVYAGYDGPCPPWNDELVHRYVFEVVALDVATLGISGAQATGPAVMKAMQSHILASGIVMGQYTLNPALVKK